MHFGTAVSGRQRRIYRVSTRRAFRLSFPECALRWPAEMRRAVVKFAPAPFAPGGLTPLRMARCKMAMFALPPPPTMRWPAPKPDRPLSTALVTTRPPLSRNGRSADFVPDACTQGAGARRLVRRLHAAVCLLSRPTAQPACRAHAWTNWARSRGGRSPARWTWSTERRQGWAPSLSKVPARICIFAWGLSVFGSGVYEGGVGDGVSSFSGRGLGDEDANVCLEVRSDTKRTFYLSKIFFNP